MEQLLHQLEAQDQWGGTDCNLWEQFCFLSPTARPFTAHISTLTCHCSQQQASWHISEHSCIISQRFWRKDSFSLLFPTYPLWHSGDIIWLIMLQLSNLQSGILPCLTGYCRRNHSVSWQKEVISANMSSVGRALSLPSILNCYHAYSISAKAFLSMLQVIT